MSGTETRLPVKAKIAFGVLLSIITILLMILFEVIGLPPIQDILFGKHSDTYVYVCGMEHSYSIDELREEDAIRYVVTVVAADVPGGLLQVRDEQMPMWFFEWTYSGDEKMYIMSAYNGGDGVGKNTKVDIDFAPNSISFVKIDNEERVKIISGGKPGGSRVVFEIDELLPGEEQYVQILVVGKSVKSVDVWSESEEAITNVSIVDVFMEPWTEPGS